jgi:T5SS/PEP-CTERM-associated repeat protein
LGSGTLNVNTGGQVSDVAGYIGLDTGSTGTVTIDGANSKWTNSGNLYVGDLVNGTLNVAAGGHVTGANGYIGYAAGSVGSVTVGGTGSLWTITGNLEIANSINASSGTLAISNGGQVSDNVATIAVGENSIGTVTVDGANSKWLNSGELGVGGLGGQATLNITAGGYVSSAYGIIGFNGVLKIGGGGSQWVVTDTLEFQEDGRMEITGGGKSQTNGFGTGIGLGSILSKTASAIVDGTGSTLASLGDVNIGQQSSGTLDVLNGASVNCDNSTIGFDSGITGVATVSGANSTWTAGSLFVGRNGHGILTVNHAGQISTFDGYLGFANGSLGEVTIDGPGSKWTITHDFYVAGSGLAMLTITNDATVHATNVLVNPLGQVRGDGNIVASIQNGGLVSPGTSPGALHIQGVYTQTAAGKLQIDLAGTTPGTQYDQLLVSGAVSLAGTLEVMLSSGFIPAENNAFDILDFASLTGTFTTLSLPALPGLLTWDTSKLYATGVLSVILPGDFNGNGVVDAVDYVIWRKGLGTTYTQSDYDVWRAHFGQTAGGGSALPSVESLSAAVPEPASALMLVMGVLVMCSRYRAAAS